MIAEPLDCSAVVRDLWSYLDESLTPERMEGVREHLANCQRCFPHADFERAFLDAVGEMRREHPDPNALRSRVLAALATAAATGAPRPDARESHADDDGELDDSASVNDDA